MYKYSEVPEAVRAGVVEAYLKAREYPVNVWFDTHRLRFRTMSVKYIPKSELVLIGRFYRISFDDLLDEFVYAFRNE